MERLVKIMVALLVVVSSANAQYKWDIGAKLGVANYLGDIGGGLESGRGFIFDLKMSETNFSPSFFARYKFHPLVATQFCFQYSQISGADSLSLNPARAGRNLSFRNNMWDFAVRGEFNFVNIQDLGGRGLDVTKFNAYVFVGVGALMHNPQAYYSNPSVGNFGQWYDLRELRTEDVSYGQFVAVLPKGLGAYLTIRNKIRIGWELTWTTTFTDYLDDVSTNYVEISPNEALRYTMANRHSEVDPDKKVADAIYYQPGEKRGDPTHNDSYIASQFSVSYVLRAKSSVYKQRYGSAFRRRGGKRRGGKRRIRAKF